MSSLSDYSPIYQVKLWCGAQHLFWSSIYGGIIGEDGRYDAFETTMEILRVKKEHPDLPPDQYAAKDKDFDRFMKCESGLCQLWQENGIFINFMEIVKVAILCRHKPQPSRTSKIVFLQQN
jgi:hypothetical protein